jgi:hypothetical protein
MLELDGNKNKRPLLFVDGVETKSIEHLNPEQIKSITVIKDEDSLNKYVEKGKNGVIEIFLKSETFEAEQKFRELISKKIKFPEEALSANIEKTLSFSVRIDENGNLSRDAFVPEINIYQPIVVIGKRIETNEAKPKNTISEVEKTEFFSKEFSRVVGEIKQVDLDELKGKSMLVNVSFKIEDVEITSKNTEPITNELELRRFIAKKIKYPYDAVEKGIVGKSSVSITIGKNGKITETGKSSIENDNIGEVVVTGKSLGKITLTEDNDSELFQKEVLRIVKLIPDLDIDELKGKTVNLNVEFRLEK